MGEPATTSVTLLLNMALLKNNMFLIRSISMLVGQERLTSSDDVDSFGLVTILLYAIFQVLMV